MNGNNFFLLKNRIIVVLRKDKKEFFFWVQDPRFINKEWKKKLGTSNNKHEKCKY